MLDWQKDFVTGAARHDNKIVNQQGLKKTQNGVERQGYQCTG